MKTKIVEQAMNEKETYRVFVATLKEGENEHSPGAVSFEVTGVSATIRSTNQRGYGAIPIEGTEYLRLVRDAFIEICKMKDIQ